MQTCVSCYAKVRDATTRVRTVKYSLFAAARRPLVVLRLALRALNNHLPHLRRMEIAVLFRPSRDGIVAIRMVREAQVLAAAAALLPELGPRRAVVVDDEIVIRPMMYVALTYDHRIVDGREAVSFLKRIKECIEDPARILVEA